MYEQLDFSQYIYGVPMEQAAFLMNASHEVQYNDVCLECRRDCKQSFRCEIIQCPQYIFKRGKRKK